MGSTNKTALDGIIRTTRDGVAVRDFGPDDNTVPSADPVVCVHGLFLDGVSNYRSVLPHLRGRRVLLVDLPGHGRSRRREHSTPDAHTDAVCDALAVCGVERAVVVGYSFGGVIAQQLVVRGVAAGVVYVATAARFDPDGTLRHVGHGMHTLASLPGPRRLPVVGDLTSQVATSGAALLFDGRAAVVDTVPAVSIITVHDRVVPVDRQYELAALARARQVPVDAGHFVHLRPEFPQLVCDAVETVSQ